MRRIVHAMFVYVALVSAAICGEKAELVQHLDALYDQYLTGDIESARQSMIEAATLLEEKADDVSEFDERGRLHALVLVYSRLYCVAIADGARYDALIAYEKARYWRIRLLELKKKSAREIVEEIRTFNELEFMTFSLRFDSKATHGRGPIYARSIPELRLAD